jgi:hypothetical protein
MVKVWVRISALGVIEVADDADVSAAVGIVAGGPTVDVVETGVDIDELTGGVHPIASNKISKTFSRVKRTFDMTYSFLHPISGPTIPRFRGLPTLPG